MKKTPFKDYFSAQAAVYQTYRPGYSFDMFAYLASLAPDTTLAWDCACGTGQASIPLTEFFNKIIATDASREQINNSVAHAKIVYRVEPAEHSSLFNHSADLIVVGQALHWFDIAAFFTEVKRVLKPSGIIAVWSYNLLTITPQVDVIIKNLNENILGDYWAPERKLVENNYKDIVFPFKEIASPPFSMNENWDFKQLLGYLNTWSAVQSYRRKRHADPLLFIKDKLRTAWGNVAQTKPICWPVTLKVGIH